MRERKKQGESDPMIAPSDSAKKPSAFSKDFSSICLLMLLYTLQGVPMGLTPAIKLMLSEKKVDYSLQTYFTLVSYPFSLKMLWAPLVDSVYSQKFGRRKVR